MPLQLSPFEYSDIPAFGLLDEASTADWPYARAQDPPGVPRHTFVEEFARNTFGKDENEMWMKVTDTETGDLCSVAVWKMPVTSKNADEDDMDKVVGEAEAGNEPANPAGGQGRPGFWADMARLWGLFEQKHIGDQPYALLAVLTTHPKHQRRGAGSMLVQWGCSKADGMGLLCALTASDQGEKVYTRAGFEVVQREVLDLTQYGIEGTEIRRRMIRPARKAV